MNDPQLYFKILLVILQIFVICNITTTIYKYFKRSLFSIKKQSQPFFTVSKSNVVPGLTFPCLQFSALKLTKNCLQHELLNIK